MLEKGIRHGTLIAVCSLILCVLGTVAAFRIPVQMIPDLEVRSVSILTGWPGATPQDVEKEILIEQERYLRTLPQLQRVFSFAVTGFAVIVLEFPFGTDTNQALIRINNALSQVGNYPENVDQPRIISSSYSGTPFMYFGLAPLEGNPYGLDMDMMRDYVDDNIRTQMERISGISQVDVHGGGRLQIQIKVDEKKLAQRGISFTEVRDAIRSRNHDLSGGDLDSGKRRYLLRTMGRFETIAELDGLILKREGDALVRLSDVALVELDHFELQRLAYVNGERLITLAVNKESGSNVIQIKKELIPIVEQINQEFLRPNGMKMWLMSDDVQYVEKSIDNVWSNLLVGSFLATFSLFVFLKSWRPTLIGILGTPICTIAAFVGLLFFDRTINVISLAGIAFAIGMTFDNSIVVLESIDKAARRGLHRVDAAIIGVKEVWTAVLASTMTTVLVFAPILFITVEAGQLYSDIAIAISAAILASMVTAIMIVPAASAWLGFQPKIGDLEKSLIHKGWILKALDWLLATTIRQLCCFFLILGMAIGAAYWLTPSVEYLPEGEAPKAFTYLIPPPGYNLNEMKLIGESINARLEPFVNADPQDFDLGKAEMPPLEYFTLMIQTERLRVLSQPKRAADVEAMMQTITKWLKEYPGVRVFSSRGSIISGNNGGTRSVNIDLFGNNLAELYQVGAALYDRSQALFDPAPQLSSDPPSLSLDQPLVQVYPKWERLAEVGFNIDSFGFTVAALSDGAYVDEFMRGDQKIDMYLFSANGNEQNPALLSRLPVLTPSGDSLPLGTLADIRETVDTANIRRLNSQRAVTLRIVPPRSVPLEIALDKVKNTLLAEARADGVIKAGVRVAISGAADQMQVTKNALSGNFMIALLLCYLLLVAIFSHWGYPLIILATVPLGIVGGIAGLAGLNSLGPLLAYFDLPAIQQPFDMITLLGFLILLGTVVNNPILIVDRTRVNLALNRGDINTAVSNAVAARLRPIFMTTLTTVLGLAPLVFTTGAGSELYRGVGIVVLSGLICSTIVTLTFLPCLLVLILRIGQRIRRGWFEPQEEKIISTK